MVQLGQARARAIQWQSALVLFREARTACNAQLSALPQALSVSASKSEDCGPGDNSEARSSWGLCRDIIDESIATAALHLADPGTALRLWTEKSSRQRRALGPRHPRLAATYNAVANSLRQLGRTDESLRMYERAFEILAPRMMRRANGTASHSCARILSNIGSLHFSAGSMEIALHSFTKARAIWCRQASENLADTAECHSQIGHCHLKLGRCACTVVFALNQCADAR
eukprot:SAG31_NODE_7880_length_1575_cov_1.536585_2_plen_229_part_00